MLEVSNIINIINKINPITFFICLIFSIPLLKGFLFKYSSISSKQGLGKFTDYISMIVGIISGIILTRSIFIDARSILFKSIYQKFPETIYNILKSKPILIFLVATPILIFLSYLIIKLLLTFINYIFLYKFLDSIENWISRKSIFTKRILGLVFEIPKSLCYVIIVTFCIYTLNFSGFFNKVTAYSKNSDLYNYICKEVIIPATNSTFAKSLPNIINNSLKVVVDDKSSLDSKGVKIKNNNLVYYNGVTLEEGMKSNDEINNFAKKLTQNLSHYDKSKKLYIWVGKNIKYDEEKAKKILGNDFTIPSGAIPTFETQKGICFDYACLYAAMCKSVGLKVRLIMGEGFNGNSWIAHAWNEVYIEELGKWINVDPTFFKGGDYFDSMRFEIDHKNAEVIGEF